MKIITNKQIQKLVDNIASRDLLRVAALISPAVSLVEITGSQNDPVVVAGQVYELAMDHAQELGRKLDVARRSLGAKRTKDVRIFLATQETSDGVDRIYLIGTPADIMQKLRKLPQSVNPEVERFGDALRAGMKGGLIDDDPSLRKLREGDEFEAGGHVRVKTGRASALSADSMRRIRGV
jgi:hypothetical protein